MDANSPISHLRACVSAYKAGYWHGPGRELEQALELLEEANAIVHDAWCIFDEHRDGWLQKYAALKGEK